MVLSLGISPCPNDTFVFSAWAHGQVDGPPVEVSFADIEECNRAAVARELDVVKVSFAALPELLGTGPDDYALLPCGGALGRGCGPLVLTREPGASLDGATVAVPGERTTAYLLLRLWHPGLDVAVMPFEQIMPAVAAGEVDAGLVIHESRFTYPDHGLHLLQDLGAWWEDDTGLPIPLGAIVARRGLDLDAIAATVRASVDHAWADPSASRPWVRAHSQEMSDDVCDAHIALYVNGFTRDLGSEGLSAVRALLDRAADAALLPRVEQGLLKDSSSVAMARRICATRRPVSRSGCLPRRRDGWTLASSSLMVSSSITCSSSAGRRAPASVGGASRMRTDSACSPRLPAATPNSSRVPALSSSTPSGSEAFGTKTSPPSSRVAKPKPLSLSKNLTLPVGTGTSVVARGGGVLQASRLACSA